MEYKFRQIKNSLIFSIQPVSGQSLQPVGHARVVGEIGTLYSHIFGMYIP